LTRLLDEDGAVAGGAGRLDMPDELPDLLLSLLLDLDTQGDGPVLGCWARISRPGVADLGAAVSRKPRATRPASRSGSPCSLRARGWAAASRFR
jgi:hypothetical protein